MARWWIGTETGYILTVDIDDAGVPTLVYTAAVPNRATDTPYVASLWSPDGGTTIYAGGEGRVLTFAQGLWKSTDGGQSFVNALSELPSPYDTVNATHVQSMHANQTDIDAGIFWAQAESDFGDTQLKYTNGVWSQPHTATTANRAPRQCHIPPAGVNPDGMFPLGVNTLRVSKTYWAFDTHTQVDFDHRVRACWYDVTAAVWFVINAVSAGDIVNHTITRGHPPWQPTADSDNGSGTWTVESPPWLGSGTGMQFNTPGHALWGDSEGNVWIRAAGGGSMAGIIFKRDKTSGLWVSDRTIPGFDNNLGTIHGRNTDPGAQVVSGAGPDRVDFRTAAGVWSQFALGTLTGLGSAAVGWPKSFWTSPTIPQSISAVTGPDGTARISTKGGEVLNVTGLFTALAPMTAHLGPAGDTTDPPCYFGFGLGYDAGFSNDGTTVQIIAPPLDKTSSAILTIVVDSETLAFSPIAVAERTWPGRLHGTRANFSPWKALGARKLGEESLE